MLGIIVGPVATDLVNVSDWDHTGVYHEIHEIAFVCPPGLLLSPSCQLTTYMIESDSHRHRNPTSQSGLRTTQKISETACGRNDHLPFTGHDYDVALYDRLYHVGRTQNFMGKPSLCRQETGSLTNSRYQHS